MIEQQQGAIINIGSALGILASTMAAHYCTSKAGVAHMTKSLALEWARYNIRVNCVVPGFMDTEMIKHTQESESQKRFLDFKIPMKRLGRAEELVGAALFLASDASSYVTGAQLVVDGGYTLW
jgi:NAD(P)-dependent dehydrogenase (short-subunit alcohol dehydrogenase family)